MHIFISQPMMGKSMEACKAYGVPIILQGV